MVVGQRLQAFGGLAEHQAEASAAEFVDPAFALGGAQTVEHVGRCGDFLSDAVEQGCTANAFAFAYKQGDADRNHQQDADHQDQHQACEQAAGPGQLHALRVRLSGTSVAATLTSAAST